MKEYDRSELIVEKYTKEGVHKGMDGRICDPRNINGQWLVCFDHANNLPKYPIIEVNEEYLSLLTSLDEEISTNERRN